MPPFPLPQIPPIPGGLNYLEPYMSPQQIATNISTRGVGGMGGLERSEAVQSYLGNLIASQLLDEQGNVTGDYNSLPPIVRQYFSQNLGSAPTSTEDFLTALGIDATQGPINQEQITEAIRNVNLSGSRMEGGDRSPGGPQDGVGRAMAVGMPSMRDSFGTNALGPAIAGALAPALGPAVGALGLGTLGAGLLGQIGETGLVGGAQRPQIGTQNFRDTTSFNDPGRMVGNAGTVADLGALAGVVDRARRGDAGGALGGDRGGRGPGGSHGGEARGGREGALGGPCFAANTQILMADNTLKPIQDIKIGDKVMSFDGVKDLQEDEVIAVTEHPDQTIIEVNGIRVTPNHPFLTLKNDFKPIGEFEIGHGLVKGNGQIALVDYIKKPHDKVTVYNFTVKKNHTYVADGYRVHNKFAYGGLIKGYADGGMINTDMNMPPEMGMSPDMGMMDPTYNPPASNGTDDLSITAQTGEYVIARPAVEALGAEFFDVLNDLFNKNPGLDPKAALKAASAMIPKTEAVSNKAQPGDLGTRIGSALGKGSFASGGLIGRNPIRI